MRPQSYKQDRYNALRISRHTPNLIHHLRDNGVIGFREGFKDPKTGIGYLSIIWPELPLIRLFERSCLPIETVAVHRDVELVRVRKRAVKEKGKRKAGPLVDYQDNELTISSSRILRAFNDLIDGTSIEIGGSEPAGASKLSYRTFSKDESVDDPFELGGRVYGGWWQQEGSDWRDRLMINGNPVVELDYHALHPRLLYARVGLPMDRDPYQLNSFDRAASKLLLLTAINAKDEKSVFQAFRHQASSNSQKFDVRSEMASYALNPDMDDPADTERLVAMMRSFDERFEAFNKLKLMTNVELREALESLKHLNEPIAQFLCSDIGIKLQRTDSDICMKVIEEMTGKGIPVLPIHDSFLVEKEHEEELREVMVRAALDIVGFPVRVDRKHL